MYKIHKFQTAENYQHIFYPDNIIKVEITSIWFRILRNAHF